MLQTCSRCRSRRIKCDSRLPACANCARNDLECTFHDDALQEAIPRSYIQSLNKRIDDLTSQLALHEPATPPFELSPTSQPLHVLIPARPGSDLHLDLSVPSRMTRVVFEAVPTPLITSETQKVFPEDDYSLRPNISYADKSQLVPSIVRFLLRRYERCIRPQYDLPVPELINNDGASFKKLPDSQKFKLLMACAIAAAREAYKSPDWRPLAQICRNWANEMISPIISTGNGDTLAAILLLLVYELADPSRGIIWELLDLAARTCLQLGWHQASHNSVLGISGSDDAAGKKSLCSPEEERLMSVLKDIEGSLQTIFNRPNMLSNFKLPAQSETEPLVELYFQISDQIYGVGRAYESQSCSFVGEVGILMGVLESLDGSHSIINEMWLLYLPVCAKHKQCLHCFQEPDEPNTKGMTTLRAKVVNAASELMTSVHQNATSIDGFLPPVIASSRAFISGCSIATGILKRWINPKAHVRELINCTEILTMFAPHWSGGHDYLRVWKAILNLLDLESPTDHM
ncbi:hypothetical protein BDW59DRAFT_78164 [Aspergillus cavernicola]|uniref:Zn(2)-C6 fungal-type domain-containing protein n=1 Tax=Aspergillus cavernicola TaxID=176166 RepID=A0ABR4IZW3_9EURO